MSQQFAPTNPRDLPWRKYIRERLFLFVHEWIVPISMVPSELHGVVASLSNSDTVPSIGRGNPLTAGRPWGIVMGYITVCTHVLWNILCPCLLQSALFWGRSSSSSPPTYLQDSRDTTRYPSPLARGLRRRGLVPGISPPNHPQRHQLLRVRDVIKLTKVW